MGNNYSLKNSYIQKIIKSKNSKKYLIELKNSKLKNWKRSNKKKPFALSFNNNFQTLTGGIMYYDYRSRKNRSIENNSICYNISYELNREDYQKVSKIYSKAYFQTL